MMRAVLIGLAIVALAIVVAIIVLRLVFPLPSLEGRTETHAAVPSVDTPLGRFIVGEAAAHGEESGIRPLFSGPDAFAVRMALADAAVQTLDVQYYIWQNDLTGTLLLDALRRAAERGVRVRLLVDDNGVPDLDQELAALNALPNAEVRLFNPFTIRNPRWLGYFYDFIRVNRRMHNKSFTADGIATVIGGRNVGDIYFESGPDAHYLDLDVLGVGQVAKDVSVDFDGYWASPSAYPVDRLVTLPEDPRALLDARIAAARKDSAHDAYVARVHSDPAVVELLDGVFNVDWVPVKLVSDDPAKGLGKNDRSGLMAVRLGEILETPRHSIDLISAYFVPGDQLSRQFERWARSGVAVRVLTNSQDATDVLPVHSGYIKHRERLAEAGVQLYELKSDAGSTQRRQSENFGLLGSSMTSLHAKTFTVDAKRIFIGSFNFDPRSAYLNTEMGFLIENPELAQRMVSAFDSQIPDEAYSVALENDRIIWLDPVPGGEPVTHLTEPNTTWVSRATVRFLSWLPIDWLL
ncbi:phospholipase D family protein [Haematobacter massiliensis]|nr:phospholipase D family protein [Haematobacter massiliensis]OWJ69362.1 phospholipase D family protein [Haematobacter massiliensis]OWJ83848.1 phospholipase D family protein [Haematobacter massiliensis]QBJ24604.1 phospholipase D family protein [Haematobacter massiliensis]